MTNKQASIIFVTETKDGYESDDFYLKRFANFACKRLLECRELTIHYVHMDGIGNYEKKTVLSNIRYYRQCTPFGPSYVVYVVDRDRVKDGDRLKRIEAFTAANGFYLAVNCRTIEDAFGQRISVSKHATAARYKQQSAEVYQSRRFHTELDQIKTAKYGCTNLGLILRDIVEDAEEWEPKKK